MRTLHQFVAPSLLHGGGCDILIISSSSDDDAKRQYEVRYFSSERAFDMKVLRERNDGGGEGGVGRREVWLPGFVLPVSSFGEYGGHASLHVRYDPSSSSSVGGGTPPLYARSPGEYNDAPAPGDNVAYLQLGVPTYRISQMVKYGGNVIDAYGWVNAICPSGLPIRAVVSVRSPGPMMFVALHCDDVEASKAFYFGLGFGEGGGGVSVRASERRRGAVRAEAAEGIGVSGTGRQFHGRAAAAEGEEEILRFGQTRTDRAESGVGVSERRLRRRGGRGRPRRRRRGGGIVGDIIGDRSVGRRRRVRSRGNSRRRRRRSFRRRDDADFFQRVRNDDSVPGGGDGVVGGVFLG